MAGNGLDRERLAHDRDSSKQNARLRRKPGARTAALLQRSQEVEDVLLWRSKRLLKARTTSFGLRRVAGERAPAAVRRIASRQVVGPAVVQEVDPLAHAQSGAVRNSRPFAWPCETPSASSGPMSCTSRSEKRFAGL